MPEHIARRVFDPQPGGLNVGNHLIRMPGGMIYLREAGAGAEVEREFFRFAIQIQVAARQVWMKDARRLYTERRAGENIRGKLKPLAAFFDDNTLSRGDVVVAVEGFRVFTGAGQFPWRVSDFVTIERWQREHGQRNGLKDNGLKDMGLKEMERESGKVK